MTVASYPGACSTCSTSYERLDSLSRLQRERERTVYALKSARSGRKTCTPSRWLIWRFTTRTATTCWIGGPRSRDWRIYRKSVWRKWRSSQKPGPLLRETAGRSRSAVIPTCLKYGAIGRTQGATASHPLLPRFLLHSFCRVSPDSKGQSMA